MSPTYQNGTESLQEAGLKDRRLLYGADVSASTRSNEPIAHSLKLARHNSSTFNTMAALFLAAVVIILYISNIIAVNRLAIEVNDLQQKYEAVQNSNEILRAEINGKSSLERIGKIAVEHLGLRYPKTQPQLLEVDGRLIEHREGENKAR